MFKRQLQCSDYLLNVLGLENVSLWVLQIRGRPKEAISFAGTEGKSENRRMKQHNKDILQDKNIHNNMKKHLKYYVYCFWAVWGASFS